MYVHFTDFDSVEGYASDDDGVFEGAYNGNDERLHNLLEDADALTVEDKTYHEAPERDDGLPPTYTIEDKTDEEATARRKVEYVRDNVDARGGRILEVNEDE